MAKIKGWKNQTTKTQKAYGGIQFISKDRKTQASVSKFDYSTKPKNWQVQISSVKEAKKGYPNSKVGITKKEALKRMYSYMKKHPKG